jgi:stage IV sporulation protein FB
MSAAIPGGGAVQYPQESLRSSWGLQFREVRIMLRWRLLGINFCIQPSFWLMNALWAYILYQPMMRPARGENQLFTRELLIMMLIWVLCMLVAVMVHELGHVILGRIFGQPGNITISGLGGQAVGEYGALSSWKRILVVAAGPCAGFLFVAALTTVDGRPWNFCMEWSSKNLNMPFLSRLTCDWFLIDLYDKNLAFDRRPEFMDFKSHYVLVVLLLFSVNLFMNIMNLLPIIPMDGGMIFKEICVMISPRSGLKVAFFFSFGLACLMTVYLLVIVLSRYKFISEHYQNYYPFAFPEFSLIVFASLAYQSLQAFRQLSVMQRHRDFMQDDDDDDSGPQRRPTGVVEIEPKDPRDFAPRAPGSERPRS